MVKFLREIRHSQMAQGKSKWYLIYAFGEVFLIVVGILIALQVNNWNEGRKERQLEKEVLNEILSNLESDLKNLDASIAVNKNATIHFNKVLEHLNNDIPITDSLRRHYAWLVEEAQFTPNTVGYDNLRSLGINIIRNQRLKKDISNLYSIKYSMFVKDREMVSKLWTDKLVDEMSENLNFIIPFEKVEPININELRLNIPFKNTIINTKEMLAWTNSRYNQGIEDIELVATSIRNELNK